ncbi:MAG TPA: ABC transporter permease subunit [Ruminococcus sp.]|nr:ABC transporter permease subunit [Ruminococcus sp.]
MNKLIKVNLKLMLHRKDTLLCLAGALFFAILVTVSNYQTEELNWFTMFSGPVMLVMIFSAVGGLFISRDYTQNTIRNKLSVGHKRIDIYLANQISQIIFFCVTMILYLAVSCILTAAFIGTKDAVASDILGNTAVCILACIALSALTTFISMTVQSAAGGVLPLIFMYPLLMFSVLVEELDIKWMKTVSEFIPVCQLTKLVAPDQLVGRHIIFSIIFTLFFVIAGTAAFRKSDLK